MDVLCPPDTHTSFLWDLDPFYPDLKINMRESFLLETKDYHKKWENELEMSLYDILAFSVFIWWRLTQNIEKKHYKYV